MIKNSYNEDIKKNLVEYLSDEETINEYLHPKNYSTFQLLKEAFKPIKSNNKLKILWVIYSISKGVLPILSAFILYYIVGILDSGVNDLVRILRVTLIYSGFFILFSILERQIYFRNYNYFSKVRLKFLHDAGEKNMTMDYGLGEKAEFLKDIETSQIAFQSNIKGVEGTYHKIFELGGTLLSFILLGIMLFSLSYFIFLVSLISLGVYVYFRKYSAKYKHKKIEKLNEFSRKVDTFNREASDFKYGKDLKLYGFKEMFLNSFSHLKETYKSYFRKYTKTEALISPITAFCVVFVEALGYYFLTKNVLSMDLNLADISLFIVTISLFVTMLNELALGFSFVSEEMMYFGNGIDFINSDLNSTSGKRTLDDDENNLSIEFKDVSFSYPGTDVLVLENLNFKINPGETMALIGVNGAGKSTVVKLLTGLYKPTSGKIFINGIDSEEIDIKSRFEAFSVVLQEVEPLAMSIAENVSASIDSIDREWVKKSLERAGLKEKIDLLEKGIDTQMTKIIFEDGTLFSGGENQKLAIARGLYKEKAKAMILDEPTASLDALAEEKIYRELEEIVGEKTLIFISHRLASTKFCDKIALLDGGNIKEFGTHEELMNLERLYKNMFETQGKYYKDKEEDNGE